MAKAAIAKAKRTNKAKAKTTSKSKPVAKKK
jgi:hypothetical protein